MDKWKLAIGFSLLIVIVAIIAYLAKLVALGNVEEKSSAGLAILLVGLIEISKEYIKGFVSWAFGKSDR